MMRDDPTNLQVLLHEVDVRLPREHANTVRAILGTMVGQRIDVTRRDIVREAQARDAAAMLTAGVARPLIVVRLMRTHNISQALAYRLVTEVMRARSENAAIERVQQ